MKARILLIFTVALIFFNTSSFAKCQDGELSFSFKNLSVRTAFSIFADYAGLKPNVDKSIQYSSPMNFGCTPWLKAAQNLANKYNLKLRIENGVMYVTK